ncbi:MAG: mitofilin family membrane protein [Pseudomonadota bacterium]
MAASDKNQSSDKGGKANPASTSSAAPSSNTSPSTNPPSGAQAAEEVIAKFGGIRPMASKLNLAVSTVQGWKERGAIPASRHDDILKAAKSQSIDLPQDLLRASDQSASQASSGQASSGQASSGQASSGQASSGQVSTGGSVPASSKDAGKGADKDDKAKGSQAVASGTGGKSDAKSGSSEKSAQASAKSSQGGTSASASSSAAKTAPASAATARPAAPPQKKGGGLGAFLLGALVLAAGAAGAVVTKDIWEPYVADLLPATSQQVAQGDSASSGDAAGEISKTAAAVDSLQQRVAALEDVTQPGTSASGGTAPDTTAFENDIAALKSQVGSLDTEMKSLSDRLTSLQEQAASGGGDTGGNAANAAELSKLSDEAASLSQRLSENEQKLGALDSLAAQVKELSDQQSGATRAAGKEIALLLASVQFRDALQGSGPFESELKAVEPYGQDDPALAAALAPLSTYAAGGVPTLAELQATFSDTAAAIVGADPASPDDSWAEGVLKRISSVVTIRPVGMAEGDGTGAIVARAEAKLNEGDLAGALTELDSLSGGAKDAAADWRNQAQGRLDASAAMAALSAAVSKLFAGTGG